MSCRLHDCRLRNSVDSGVEIDFGGFGTAKEVDRPSAIAATTIVAKPSPRIRRVDFVGAGGVFLVDVGVILLLVLKTV